jgi:pyruvate/2-oxoglutarate dehydrogenase complex dihydrolipoamide acyltransferase (E2) component
MPEHASRFAGLYDQQNENRIPDWGGDELFTRMPSPPAVDDAPAPRFRPSLMLVDAPAERRRTPPGEEWRGTRDRRRAPSAEEAMRRRAERLGISVIEERGSGPVEEIVHAGDDAPEAAAAPAQDESPGAAAAREWEATHAPDARGAIEPPPERAPNGRRTTVITGRPEGAPRPISLVPAQRRRPPRTPAEWIGPRPERIVAWAFALGLLLILIAISTADAATL